MSEDIWKGFADMLAELFAKYGARLLEIEQEEDNNIDLTDIEGGSNKEKGT